jgi:3-oxoacyl-[acyl-carrier protein] reductase
MDPAGKVALVTGGGTGLGKAISLKLAAAGAAVAVNYPGADEFDAHETVAQIEQLGGRGLAVKGDVGEPDEIASLAGEVRDVFGGVDVLVNNAGTTSFIPFPDLAALGADEWDRIMGVNCRGPFLLVRELVPELERRGGGAIVNVTSASALRGTASSCIAYSVSKAGLQMLTQCLAVALAPRIRVNSVAPGGMLTRWGRRWGEEVLEQQAQALPLEHHAAVADVADAVLFTISNESMTGQNIVVDSGWLLA